jgi:hypothetical protein
MNESNCPSTEGAVRGGPTETNAANGGELELLRQRVRELEQANEQYRQELATVRAERDLWQKESVAWAWKEMNRTDPLTPERVEQMIREEEWQPFETIWDDFKRDEEGS